eukprot:988963-Amphidinium_carterae.1
MHSPRMRRVSESCLLGRVTEPKRAKVDGPACGRWRDGYLLRWTSQRASADSAFLSSAFMTAAALLPQHWVHPP